MLFRKHILVNLNLKNWEKMKNIKNAKNPRILLVIPIALVVLSNNVFAYIDPGSGGVILNTIWPLIVALFAAVGAFLTKYFWSPIKGLFSKIFGKRS